MDRHKIERMCRNAGMRPEIREKIGNIDLFIADGFSLPPHRWFKKFGVEPEDFPFGMYATLWWVSKKEDHLDVGQPLFFDKMENSKLARINAARKEARLFVERRKKAN